MTDLVLKLVNMSVSAGWIVLAVLLIRLLLKKAPKWINVLLWGVVGLRLCLPFSIKSMLSVIPSTNTLPSGITQTTTPHIQSGFDTVNEVVNPILTETVANTPTDSANPIQIAVFVMALVWVLGVAVMLGYTLVSYLLIMRRTKGGRTEAQNIVRCAGIDNPFIMGIIKPKIYIPSFLNEQDSKYVIEHEKSHIKRRDYWWKPLGFAFLTVYWFNPLMWLAYILLCRDIEFACDEKVIKKYGEEYKVPYSRVLIECSIPRKAITACPVAFGEVGIKTRIKNILKYKKPALWVTVISVVLIIALCVFFLTDPLDKKKADKAEKKEETSEITETVTYEIIEDTTSEPKETVTSIPTENTSQETEPQNTETLKPKNDLSAKRKELFDKLSPKQSVEVRNQVVDWLLSASEPSKKKLYTEAEIAKMRAECNSYDIEPNLILVTLTEKASKELFFKEFTPKDFPSIDCKKIKINSSERSAVLTGKGDWGGKRYSYLPNGEVVEVEEGDYILDKFEGEKLWIDIYVNEQTNENIIENMIKLQKMDIVEYVGMNYHVYGN